MRVTQEEVLREIGWLYIKLREAQMERDAAVSQLTQLHESQVPEQEVHPEPEETPRKE